MERQLRSLPWWISAIGIAAILGLTGILFIRPWSAPVGFAATPVSGVTTLGAYLTGTRKTTSGRITDHTLASQPGRVVTFQLTNFSPGAEDRCELRWTAIDRGHNQPVVAENWRYDDVIGWPDGLLGNAGGAAEELPHDIWVPLPSPFLEVDRQVDRYFIRLRLLCEGRELASIDTKTFRLRDDLEFVRAVGTLPP